MNCHFENNPRWEKIICYLTITPSAFNRNESKGKSVTFSDMHDLLYAPTITNAKNGTVYILPYIFNSEIAIKDNCESQTALFLDIDGTATIDDVQNHLKGLNLEYYLYTTFSHSPEKHKFRAIVPFKKPIPKAIFDTDDYKRNIMDMFPYNDPATLKVQGFFAPNTNKLDDYRCTYFNTGNHLDASIFEGKPKFPLFKKFLYDYAMNRKSYHSNGSYDVSQNEKVQAFLGVSYPEHGGDAPSFRAICVAVVAHDDATLEKIRIKMLSENWKEKQIQHKIENAKKNLL